MGLFLKIAIGVLATVGGLTILLVASLYISYLSDLQEERVKENEEKQRLKKSRKLKEKRLKELKEEINFFRE